METDIWVWKNTLCCFIKIISKTQAEAVKGLRLNKIVFLSNYHVFSIYLLCIHFILFSNFSGTHVRMCVQVATPLVMDLSRYMTALMKLC